MSLSLVYLINKLVIYILCIYTINKLSKTKYPKRRMIIKKLTKKTEKIVNKKQNERRMRTKKLTIKSKKKK